MSELYISTKGQDIPGRGAKNKPYKSISYAISQLSTGRISKPVKILVEPGIYRDTIIIQSTKSNILPKIDIINTNNSSASDIDIANEKYTDNKVPTIKPKIANLGKAIFTINANNITIKGIHVDGEKKTSRGFNIYSSENVTIEGCKIQNCYAHIRYTGKGSGSKTDPFQNPEKLNDSGSGGGITISGSAKIVAKEITIKHCVFTDNRSHEVYKVFLSKNKRKKVKEDLLLKWNEFVADLSEGNATVAKKIKKSEFESREFVEYLRFMRRKSKSIPGLLRIIAKSKIKIAHCKIDGLIAKLQNPILVRNGGAHIAIRHCHTTIIDNCIFEKGFSGGRGGAIKFDRNAYGKVTKCLFQKNHSVLDGGGLAVVNQEHADMSKRQQIAIHDCVFKQNTTKDDGGGVYFTTATHAKVTKCLFEMNKSEENGGGMRISFGSVIFIENCKFTMNEANTNAASKTTNNRSGGGAIAVRNAHVDIKKTIFKNNHAHGFAGGAIYFITADWDRVTDAIGKARFKYGFKKIFLTKYKMSKVTLKIQNSTFENNHTKGKTCFSECGSCSSSQMQSRGTGGALYVLRNKALKIPLIVDLKNNIFLRNLGTHVDNAYKSEITLVRVDALSLSNNNISKHPNNIYNFTLSEMASSMLNKLPDYLTTKQAGLLYEDKMHP